MVSPSTSNTRVPSAVGFTGLACLGSSLLFGSLCTAMSAGEVEVGTKVKQIFAGAEPSSVDELKAMEATQQKLARQLQPYIVAVRVGPAHGSGVIVSPSGYILTAAHVAGKPNQSVVIHLDDGRIVRGVTLGLHRSMDAALVKIDSSTQSTWPYAEIGQSEEVKPGQWVMTLGHPGGYKANRQAVVRFARVLEVRDEFIRSGCKLVGGDSGGPLFNTDGQVIGIHSRIGSSLHNNLHIPIDAFRDSWERLVAGEVWGRLPGTRPFLGVQGDEELKLARISHVFPNTPAAKAGLRAGDVVLRFDGRAVADFDSLIRMVDTKNPGDKVKITVRRENRQIKLSLEMGSRGA